MKRLFSLSAVFVLLGFSVFAFTGCSKDSSSPMAPMASAPADEDFSVERARAEAGVEPTLGSTATALSWGVSRIMVVHASPDAPAVDAFLGIQPLGYGLTFPNHTRYRYTWSGERNFRLNLAGTTTAALKVPVTLNPRTFYSAFAVNRVSALEPLLLTDDLTPPAMGKAHVRFVHLSPDAPAVDVALAGGAVVFGDKEFKGFTPFTPLPAGTYDLEVRVAGTSTVALPLPGIKLEAGKIYTVFAKGLLGDGSLGAQIIDNSAARRWW